MDDRIILGLTVSLFLSVYVTAAALAVTVGYLIKKGMLGEIIRTVPRGKALVAFALLGAAVSLLRGNWVGLLASAGVLCVALVALYVRSIMTRPLLKRVIRTACVASILCLPVAIVQLALSGDPSFRAPATFENPNYYAAILEFVFLVCVNQLMMPGSRGEKLLYSMTLAANLVSLYICNCRSSLMVVMIVTPVLLLIHRRYRWAAVDLVASLAVMLLLKVEPGLFQRMEESGHDFLVRQSIWENALKGFLETPLLGRGPLGYIELARTQGLTFRVHAHNVALDLLLNYGLMGASLLAVYFSGVGKTLWMLLKTKADNHLCAMALGLVAAVAVHGVADVTIFSLQVGLLFALLIGCTGVYERDWVGQRVYRFHPKSVQAADTDAAMRLRNRKG